MPTPRVEEKGTGLGWAFLRLLVAGVVLLFSFIGFGALLGSGTGWLPLLFAFFLATFWFFVARNFRWEGALLSGLLLALLAWFFMEVMGFLLHRGRLTN